jgi:hypothetical protein
MSLSLLLFLHHLPPPPPFLLLSTNAVSRPQKQSLSSDARTVPDWRAVPVCSIDEHVQAPANAGVVDTQNELKARGPS